MGNEEITREESLKLLNEKKVEAFNLIRQISGITSQLNTMNNQYAKLNQEITKLEQEYIEANKIKEE